MGAKKEKPRASGTMTESAFWSYIRSALRQRSRFWKPIQLAKLKVRRKYNGSNKRQKYEYKCNSCKNWFPAKEVNVDHILPVGTLKASSDLPQFVDRLFCEEDNLQVLCGPCHDKKTSKELKNGKSKSKKAV